jgi:DNA-directed RNA polymerase subunit N (RpoN/RPB10)
MLNQALGVELYFPVRCTCNKPIGQLEQDYRKLIKIMEEEISDELGSIIDSDKLSLEQKSKIYNDMIEEKFINIMEILGLQRYCCRMNIRYLEQVNVGNPIAPPGNIAVTKYMIDGKGIRRNPTLIYLTKPSKVPGGSNVNMISLTSFDDNLDPFERRIRDETLGVTSEQSGKWVETFKTMSSGLPATESDLSVITHQSGSFKSIKRKPKIKNVEIVGDHMDVVPTAQQEVTAFREPRELMDVDESDFMALDKLNIKS